MDDVIIVGSLDKKELEKSIQDLVNYVGDKTNAMANKFTEGLDKMKLAMKDFAITQKVSVDTMQEAWRKMSQSFDAMVAAQSAGNRSGSSGSSGSSAQPNTIGELKEQIRLQQQKVDEQIRGTAEAQKEVNIHRELQRQLKQETKDETKRYTENAKRDLRNAISLPQNDIAQATKRLQELQSVLNKWKSKGFLDVSEINRLENAIDRTKKKIEQLRNTRPQSIRDVLGMDESSVDAIAKKMQALRRVSIDPNNKTQVKQLGDEYQRLSRLQSELLGRNIQATHSNNMLAQSFGYIRNRVVYALTLGAITSFVKQIYEIRGQYELLERSLGVLVNSFERGSQIFKELNQMAIESPFTLMELAGAAKQLTAYNFEAKEVVDTTRRLADISAALGVPMERLTYNLGQIRAQTVLTARDARDFANAGLPIVTELAKHFTELEGRIVTTGDVYGRMSKKMVSYSDVMAVINKMTDEGGKFFEFQAKQAQTLRVQMANLTLAWNNMLNEIGSSNQSLLTLPIQGLKVLLQNWSSIDRVIKSLVVSFGVLKVAQMVAISRFGVLATGLTTTAKQMALLANTARSLGQGLMALAANPWTWAFVGITALIDLGMQMKRAHDELVSLNNDIKNNANEASESMLSFLNNKGNREANTLAKQNALTAEQGEKAWEEIQSQIEQSAMSSNKLIAELLQIEDINKRVKVGFDYVSNIQKAQAALQDLKDTTIKFSSDIGWGGMFGEGVVSDLKDYARALERVNEGFSLWDRLQFETKNTREGDVLRAGKELSQELDDTAESINNFIRAYNITDPLQINEIYERVKAQIKARNPEIKGELAHIFDIGLDQKMAQLTNNAIDSNTSLWNIFMERLRHNSSSAFQDITDDWVNNKQKTLSNSQQEAVDKNLEYFKNSMPYAYDAVAQMVQDASQLKIHIGITFGAGGLSDFQKEVQKRISEVQSQSPKDFGSNALLPTNQQNLTSWVDARRKEIKKLQDDNKTYEQDNTEWAKEHIKNNNALIGQNENLLDLFHQSHKTQKEIDAENRKANAANKKANAERKHEIDEVANAIKDELSIVKQIQSNYDKLRKAGVSNTDAINLASKGYEMTLLRINNVLQKFGINKFNASDFAGKNVKQLLDTLTKQRDSLLASGKVKTSSLKDLDVEIQKLTIDTKAYDLKKITDGLNNELGKLKDEYELGIELDANPEIGNIFADYMGVNVDELPKNFEQAAKRAQKYINDLFAQNNRTDNIDISSMLDRKSFNRWVSDSGLEMDSGFVKAVGAYREYLHKVQVDETKKQTDEWNKLLEKYAEYEYKVTQIQKEAEREREVARKKGASQDILDAINNREQQQLAQLSFEEFQKTPEWIVATGELANMSRDAIGTLISKLELYKKTARNLTPKQIKEINKALKALYKEQRQGNPFGYIANMLDRAKDKSEDFDEEISKVEQEIRKTETAIKAATTAGNDTSELENHLTKLKKRWKDLKETQEGVGKLDANAWVGAINETISAVKTAIGVFDDLAKAISGVKGNSDVDKVFSILEKAGGGAAIGAQIGGGYGAIIGAVAGGLTGLITTFADKWSGNEGITKNVQESERSVKRLELAFIDLEHAISDAYGAATAGAQKVAIANKELQLEELKRQLNLESSRKEKNRDENRILELQKQIKELEYDIKDSTSAIVNDLLGISSVGDALENVMKNIIDAFRGGSYKLKDIMKDVKVSFNDMIAEMVMKMYTTKVLQPWFEEQWNAIQEDINSRANEDVASELAKIQNTVSNAKMADMNEAHSLSDALRLFGFDDWQIMALRYFDKNGNFNQEGGVERLRQTLEGALKDAEKKEMELQKNITEAMMPTQEDIMKYAELLRSGQPIIEDNLKEIESFLRELGLINDKKTSSLSALQQGIQGITEDTAGALEAYMNGVSQQVYLHSDLLTQIRDAVVGFDLDVQTATVSQILLQLQNSYQVQMSIQSILSGWSNPSGMAMRVEMVS